MRKITKSTPTIAALPGLAILLCLGAATAQAQFTAGTVILDEDFTGADGSFPTDWHDSTNSSSFTPDTVEIRNNALVHEDPVGSSASVDKSAGFTGSFNSTDATNWEDYTVEAIWSETRQDATAQGTGLLARWQGTSNPFDGYFAYESDGDLIIARDFNTFSPSETVLATTSLSRTPANNEETRLVFTVEGNQLTAEMFEEDGNTGNFTISMGSVTTTDSTYSTGSVGTRATFSFEGRSATFDDLTVTAIPEPGAYALLGGLLALGAIMLRQRTR